MTDHLPVELAQRYGTPSFVYQLDAVERAHADLRAALPRSATLYYSLKANPHPEIVALLHRLGCRAEVSSAGEIAAALAAGVRPGSILVTGPAKADDTVEHALRHRVRRFSVESPTELARLDAAAARHRTSADCLLRVNADDAVPGAGLSMTGTASQFGADLSWVLAEPGRFGDRDHAVVRGLHLYMGTNLTDESRLHAQFAVGLEIAAQLRGVLPGIREVDLGGGFGLPFARAGDRPRFPGLAGRIEASLDDRLPGWRAGQPEISFESGRYLVGAAGALVSRVVDVKTSKGTTFVLLDTGVHHLGGMSGLRRIPNISADVRPTGDDARSSHGEVTVAGPLCTPLDVLGRDIPLGNPAVGDLVTVPNAGAYGPTASLLAFLGHPAPTEVVVRGRSVRSVSRLDIVRRPQPTKEQ